LDRIGPIAGHAQENRGHLEGDPTGFPGIDRAKVRVIDHPSVVRIGGAHAAARVARDVNSKKAAGETARPSARQVDMAFAVAIEKTSALQVARPPKPKQDVVVAVENGLHPSLVRVGRRADWTTCARHCQTWACAAGGCGDAPTTGSLKTMFMRKTGPAAALALLLAGASAVWAETPPDTLVIADKIDDIVSLDPAESFEFSGNDALNNIYDTLIELDPANLGPLVPGLATSWEVAEDGVTYTFALREDAKFHSGNPVTAEDAAWSLQRAVILNKTPAFILTQFGFTPENVAEKIRATGEHQLTIVTDKPYAPSFFFNCLTAVVASVVDKTEAMAHEADGDLGYEWLKTNSAGSGPYRLRQYRPSDSYVLEAVPGNWRGDPPLARVFVRHVAEPATQRLLIETATSTSRASSRRSTSRGSRATRHQGGR
jgi:hypothetical protein